MTVDTPFPVLRQTVLDTTDARALEGGATVLFDRTDDPEEPLRVYADPAGHPFCLLVAEPPTPP